jgi:hypothetical protein
MSAYAACIWTSTLSSNVSMAIYCSPRRLPMAAMFYPTAPFVRAVYLLVDPCTWEKCYGDYDLAPEEFHEMCIYLLLNAIAYFIMALYLN